MQTGLSSSRGSRKISIGTDFFAYSGQVCRHLAGIVNGSAQLQYIIELAVAGMEDGCPEAIGPSTAERRQALEAYSERWRTLQFPDEIDLATQHAVRHTTSDGYVIARISTTNILEIIQFPSRSRLPQGDLKTWTITGADIAGDGVNMEICAIDSTQDLLVVVELSKRDAGRGRVPLISTLR